MPDTQTVIAPAPPAPPVVGTAAAEMPRPQPDWKLVGMFYAIAFGWVSLVALVLYLMRTNMSLTQAPVFAQLAVGFFYMPAPLVAALITERVGRRRSAMHALIREIRWGRFFAICALTPVGLYLTGLALTFVLGNLAHVPGVGQLVTSQAQFIANVARLIGPERYAAGAAKSPLPPFWLFLVIGLVVAPLVGFTINGLFGFGEEYGWRGFLMNELKPLGPVKGNLITGAMWGFWHAPLIFMGFNYAPYNLIGPLFMIALCVPFSFWLWNAREYTGSVLAAAVLHGAFNGMAGILAILTAGRSPLVGIPTGLLGALSVGLIAIPVAMLAKRSPAARPA